MNIPLHMSLLGVLVLLAICPQMPSSSKLPNATPAREASRSASQMPSPRPSTEPSAEGVVKPTSNASPTPVQSPEGSEHKESFSQLTLFLFASGLALFVALLGWSDQIRGIDKDTRELEERFLKKTGINKTHFVEIVKSGEPEKQLLALTQAINDGKLMSNVSVKVLESFDEYVSKLRPLERLSDRKYKMTIALTIVLFVSGTASLFTNPTQAIFSIRLEMIILVVPMILIGVLLVIIIRSAAKEKVLRSLLSSMSDMV